MKKEDESFDPSEIIKYMPSNEEIVYSTICNADIAISHTVGRSVTTYKCWSLTPFILTPLGFLYYGRPYKYGTYGDALPTYNSLLNILSITKNGFMVIHVDPIAQWAYPYKFTLVQDSMETKEQFKHRLNEFKLILLKNIKNAAEHMLTYINQNLNKEDKDYSPLWKVNKSILMDSRDLYLNDFINNDTTIQDTKKNWEQALLEKAKSRIKYTLRNNYISLLDELLKAFTYKEGNVGYIRYYINSDIELEAHLHLEELHSRMTKFSDHISSSGVTPTSNTTYRSIFHNKASKKLLKIITLADKKILKVQGKMKKE
ncbi:MAG: hypothetical protein ACFE8E_12315 [Candidatus Hodarchaeota archaeon]